MGVLVKVVHTAIAQGRDPKEKVMRWLLKYRNTRHPSTGFTPAELLMNRRPRTKIPSLRQPAEGEMHQRAQAKDQETRAVRKEMVDRKKRAGIKNICPGDRVLVKQQKSTIKPPYDPAPYTVTSVKAAQVTAETGSKSKVRDMSRVKLLKQRPEHLRKREARVVFNDSDSAEDFMDIKTVSLKRPAGQEPFWEEQELFWEEQDAVGEERQLMVELLELEDVVEEQQDSADTPPRRGGLRPRVNRKRYDSSSDD